MCKQRVGYIHTLLVSLPIHHTGNQVHILTFFVGDQIIMETWYPIKQLTTSNFSLTLHAEVYSSVRWISLSSTDASNYLFKLLSFHFCAINPNSIFLTVFILDSLYLSSQGVRNYWTGHYLLFLSEVCRHCRLLSYHQMFLCIFKLSLGWTKSIQEHIRKGGLI